MKDKVSQVCDYILDRLESGEYRAGEAIPSARKIEKEVDASFAMIQHAVTTLAQAGILHCVNRQGSIVRENWRDGLLAGNLVLFDPARPWVPGFRKLLQQRHPQLRLGTGFSRGMFELRTTLHAQQFRDEYLDLAPLFHSIFDKGEEFFRAPFRGFRETDGSIRGIPFIFSPRVMFCNPVYLRKAGIKMPDAEWTFDDFLSILNQLKEVFPTENLLNYSPYPFFWMNFVFRCGGALIDPAAENPVQIDSPETIRGIEAVRALRHLLPAHTPRQWGRDFCNGGLAFMLGDRELLNPILHSGMKEWQVLPLPHIPGGADRMAQSTDLLCIRKECVDPELAAEFLHFMLSEEVQDYIAAEKYGIPVRKSSAQKSIDVSDPRDILFLTEMESMSAEYNLDSPELTRLIQGGIRRIINNGTLPLKQSLEELAQAVRVFLLIKNEEKLETREKKE